MGSILIDQLAARLLVEQAGDGACLTIQLQPVEAVLQHIAGERAGIDRLWPVISWHHPVRLVAERGQVLCQKDNLARATRVELAVCDRLGGPRLRCLGIVEVIDLERHRFPGSGIYEIKRPVDERVVRSDEAPPDGAAGRVGHALVLMLGLHGVHGEATGRPGVQGRRTISVRGQDSELKTVI